MRGHREGSLAKPAAAQAAIGSLHTAAAFNHAQADCTSAALDAIARALAVRTNSRKAGIVTPFRPTTVAEYEISVRNALGDPAGALRAARQILTVAAHVPAGVDEQAQVEHALRKRREITGPIRPSTTREEAAPLISGTAHRCAPGSGQLWLTSTRLTTRLD